MKKVRYLVYGLFGGFVVLCPLVFDCFSALCRFRAAFVCLYALGFIFLLKALLVPGRRLRIALPDVLLALYLSWGACNLLFVKAGGTDALPIFEWISLLLGYLLARSVPERAVPLVLGAIVCSGCVQAAVGFLQWLDVLPSNHNLFPVTGSFMNPGPYGGYLAVCWVVGAGLAIRAVRRRRWPSAAGWAVAVLVVGCLLALSDSRAAWLAVLLALAWLLCRAAGIRWTGIPVGLKIAAAVVFAGVLCALYGYKKGSADARLLIWRVSCRMFVESPVTGSGIASYASRYMDAQSEYFAENPQSPFLDVAGNNHRAFNEFIRVGCGRPAARGRIPAVPFRKIPCGPFPRSDPGRDTGVAGLFVFFLYVGYLSAEILLCPVAGAVATASASHCDGAGCRTGRRGRARFGGRRHGRSVSGTLRTRFRPFAGLYAVSFRREPEPGERLSPGRDLSSRFHVGILPASLSEPAVLRLPGRIPRLSCPCAEDVGNAVRSGKRLFERLRVP